MKKDSFLSFFILVATLLLTIFYVQPLIDQDSQLALSEQQKTQELQAAQQSLDVARKTKEDFDRLTEAEKENLRTQIPVGVEQQSIIQELSTIAERYNTRLVSITFSNSPEKEGIKRIAVVANFVSPIPLASNAVAFLGAVENSNRLLITRSVALLFSPSRSDMTLTLESYYKQ